jgi:integrase/recombinase XerD
MSTHPGGFDTAAFPEPFSSKYRALCKHLKLKGLQPKTIDAYARPTHRLLPPARHFPLLECSQTRPVRLQVLHPACAGQALFGATRVLSYRVFYFTLYSMGLRLSEGLALRVGDIDAVRHRVHIRDSKGNRDRFVPLPQTTLEVLRRFWQTHRNPELLFPNRLGGLAGACQARSPLDRGGVQKTLHHVCVACGLKKRAPRTACATAMPHT